MAPNPFRTSVRPVTLTAELPAGQIWLRPCTPGDEHGYLALRRTNQDWLAPWDATTPESPVVAEPTQAGVRKMLRTMARHARAGTHLPWLLWFRETDTGTDTAHQMVGQVTVGPIIGGSARTTSIGYWLDQGHAGRGLMTSAVALACDHLFFERGLHRVEINIRPENTPSLRVVEKLGFREEGLRRRYLHIAGEWTDHRSFALTSEEVGPGLLARLM
ncbi:GNAT family N-acetyltransferase [Nesterenkonia xinjiangensis]|uniref:Ribosomal-protein-alanine N-acetyltransferase n=1 Tax=Nesterenkonia xinjiangensis TaxID=225327 RepID=A0A7Z0GKP4_9MICC|nr:GNAT family protein [Nesterenkonia xinjiangensis]NYJ76891.1 ribosomal-protein-alanine N-acetyltransferase [Nesterenkonia xinjiangensis]